MVKIFFAVLVMLLALSFYIIKPISAGGDKVRGTDDNNSVDGGVYQNTNTDFEGVCPFGVCPPEESTE